MLSPEYLKGMPENIVNIFNKLEEDIIYDISRRIKKDLELTATADYQIDMLGKMGYELDDVKKKIEEATKLGEQELEHILRQSSRLSYSNDRLMYALGGKDLPDMQPKMADFIDATIEQSKGELRNITRTMGFGIEGMQVSFDSYYRDSLDYATFQLGSGAFDYNTVLKNTVNKLGDRGITTIGYASGRVFNVESAVRLTVMTASSQIVGLMSEQNADMMGQDLMEITAHAGARPSHAEWQGQVVSRTGVKGYLSLDDVGYGTGDGFKGWNCRHNWFPYFEGISRRAYSENELKNIDNEPFVDGGRSYTHYEATQRQRHLERQIRESKRKLKAFDGAGLEEEFTAQSIKLRRQREEYERFSQVAGIRSKPERLGTYGYGRSIASKASHRAREGLEWKVSKENLGNWRQAVKESVLGHGFETGNENLSWHDKKGNQVFPILFGNHNSVEFTPELIDFLRDAEPNSLVTIHNHPNSSAFSGSDIGVLNEFESIAEMEVIGHDGTEYFLSIGDGERLTSRQANREFKKLKDDLKSKYIKMYIDTGDQKKTWKEHSNEVLERMAEERGWTYERKKVD